VVETSIDRFHFLRPLWLVLIPFAIWLHFRLRHGLSVSKQWQTVIAPHLLANLRVGGKNANIVRPYQLMTGSFILASMALSGPTWQREITPFTQDRAPLVIALELTPTMLAIDQSPTRLERAKQKIRDLLSKRIGARTAVIAYAGSAHAVLPLTDDSKLIEQYLASLLPSLMPREGDNADAALDLANDILESDDTPGTILFMTDGIDRLHAPGFAKHKATSADQILFLAFGGISDSPIAESGADGKTFGLVDGNAPPVDIAGINTVAIAAGSAVVRAAPDLSDIDSLSGQIQTHLIDTIQQDERLQWRDFGYFFVWPLAFLVLLWAQRGWTVHWVRK
jgi:Ca-activated chloride channel family protein